jgi:hypothetical protein
VHRQPAKLAAPAILVAALAAVAVGCGGSSNGPSVASLGTTPSTTTTTAGGTALPPASGGAQSRGSFSAKMAGGEAFSACMRAHGEPNFPDPGAQGTISINSASGIDPGSPKFQSAQHACAKLLPGGGRPPSPAQQAAMQRQALRFSACMRAHGEPKFPDPDFKDGGVAIRIGAGTGIDPRSPLFQAAQTACQSELPGLKTRTAGAAGGGNGRIASAGAGGQ